MKRHLALFVVLSGAATVMPRAATLHAHQTPPAAAASSSRDIDRDVWNVIIDTVLKDDIVRMGSTYSPDAVIVTPTGTQPIKSTLDRWGKDMVTNKAKGTHATVAFRFSQRLDGPTTAFESGIFNYTTIDKEGKTTPGYYPFEQLLVKIDGRWRIAMERQFAAVTKDAWDKLPSTSR
jgi:uncharacterized protein (TIGR02246 family)